MLPTMFRAAWPCSTPWMCMPPWVACTKSRGLTWLPSSALHLQEIAKLTNDLIMERNEHDTTREQLAQAKSAAGRASGSMRSPAASAGASPAGAGSGPAGSGAGANTAGRQKKKRRRMDAVDEADEDMQGTSGWP